MKLLIPTDFSSYADYALQMGINIAKTTKAEIHLLHCLDEINLIDKINLGKTQSEDVKMHIQRWAQEKLELLQREVSNHGIECKIDLLNGRLLDNLQTCLNKDSYAAIVMGSHGASGKEEWFIGSNTSKAVRRLHNNILVVKKPVETLDFSEVVFVTGLHVDEKKSFRIFLDFIKPFDVKELHIMSVDTYNYFAQPSVVMKEALEDFKEIASDLDAKCHFYSDFSIQAGIRHFTEDFNIDLIGISNYIRSPLKRMFQGSNVEMLVNHSALPVLSIDYK